MNQTKWRNLTAVGAIAITCFLTAKLALSSLSLGTEASPLWPPAGVALAALFWQRQRAWLGVALGISLFNYSMGVPWMLSSGSVLGNTIQAIVGAALLRRAGFRPSMERLQDVLRFISLAVLVMPLVNATIGTAIAYSVGHLSGSQVSQNWWTVWLGDGMGILVFTPLLLLGRRVGHRQESAEHRTASCRSAIGQWPSPDSICLTERLVWVGSLVIVAWTIFYSHTATAIAQYPLEYLPFPFVMWAALRLGQPSAIVASFLLSVIAIGGTVSGHGPFIAKAQEPHQVVLLLQAFMGVVTITALIVAAVMAERQRAEDLLRRSQASLANAQQLARLGNWDFDFDQQQWSWSDELYRLLGFPLEKMAPSPEAFLKSVHPADRERVQQAFITALEDKKSYQIDYRILLPDGSERIMEEQVVIGRADASGTVQDITARKQAEAQLRLTAERNHLLSEMALRIRRSLDLNEILNTTVQEVRQFLQADRVFICHFDPQGRGRVVAESVASEWPPLAGETTDATDYPEIQTIFEQERIWVIDDTAQVERTSFFKQYHDRYQIKAGIGVPIILDTSFSCGQPFPVEKPGGRAKGGGAKWTHLPYLRSIPQKERLLGVLVVHQCSAPRHWYPMEIDLLDQLGTQVAIAIQQGQLYKQVQCLNANLEQQVVERTLQLQENMAALEELNKLRDVFLHAIAHDLRTTVIGTLMVLKNFQKQPGEQIPVSRSMLERMTQSGEVQLSKLNALLEAYANKTEGIVLQPEEIRLPSLLQTVLAEVEPLFQQNQATLTTQIAADLPPITADPTQLQRVLNQLLTNAVKHNPPGVQVNVQATLKAQVLHCSVEDNGQGISSAQRDRLFDFQLASSQDYQLRGISLGLCLCQQIISAHGGKIGVDSTPGNGSRFWFTLPVKMKEE